MRIPELGNVLIKNLKRREEYNEKRIKNYLNYNSLKKEARKIKY
jgi:hypothetical protein